MLTNNSSLTFPPTPRRRDFQNLTGRTFNRLTVLGYAGKSQNNGSRWICRCVCGSKTIVSGTQLKSGMTKSCGCFSADYQRKQHTTHGLSGTPTWKAWKDMRKRCGNPKCRTYPLYGGRGIKVCASWQNSFEMFLAEMGERPSAKHSLDRVDNNGDYTPENCRWATWEQQSNNKRDNHYLTFQGKTQSLTLWSREINIHPSTLRQRLSYGWSVEKTLTKPVRC